MADMETKTFKEKHIDQDYDWKLAKVLATEFMATFTFMFVIMTIPLFNLGSAYTAMNIALVSIIVVSAFGPRCGAPYNPAIIIGFMVVGKMKIVTSMLIRDYYTLI